MLRRSNSMWFKELHKQKVCVHTELLKWFIGDHNLLQIHFSSVWTLLASTDHLAHTYAFNLEYEQSLFFCEVSRFSQKLKLSGKKGKISALPHTTTCIQFLDRENNDKNNKLPLRKQICFTIACGCAEILPEGVDVSAPRGAFEVGHANSSDYGLE